MRTAEEIIRTIPVVQSNFEYIATKGRINGSLLIDLKRIINEARIEAIKECAESARALPMKIQDDYDLAPPQTYYADVNKQSILSLIEQVK